MQAITQSPFIFSDERKYRIRRHLAFWVFWWLFQAFLYSVVVVASKELYFRQLPVSIIISLAFMPIHIFLSYTLMYFVVPRYLLKQKYLLTATWVAILFIITAAMSTIFALTIIPELQKLLHSKQYKAPGRLTGETIFLSLLAGLRGGVTIGGIAASIKLMKHWYIKEQRNLQLQKENAESQLQLLKAQIHPHFLFNTLNNIYSHTQNTAPVASHLVMGLSDMLRFMLYECNKPLVPLSKELKLIHDYITLEKIRYDDQLDIHIDLPADTHDLAIAPLLLLPLVENCFKHGTSNMIEQPWLNLQMHLEGNRMYVKLMNGKTTDIRNNNHTGIGLLNVSKRLLLLYPGKHELNIRDEADVFIVNLWLQLEAIPVQQKKEDGTFILSYHE